MGAKTFTTPQLGLVGAGILAFVGVYSALSGAVVSSSDSSSSIMNSVSILARPSSSSQTSVTSHGSEKVSSTTSTTSVVGSVQSSERLIEVHSSVPVLNYSDDSHELTPVPLVVKGSSSASTIVSNKPESIISTTTTQALKGSRSNSLEKVHVRNSKTSPESVDKKSLSSQINSDKLPSSGTTTTSTTQLSSSDHGGDHSDITDN